MVACAGLIPGRLLLLLCPLSMPAKAAALCTDTQPHGLPRSPFPPPPSGIVTVLGRTHWKLLLVWQSYHVYTLSHASIC